MFKSKIRVACKIQMSNGTRIDFVEQCTHLGTIIYSDITLKKLILL